MRIIHRIEINYFRSLYTLSISPANDINIFVGGNDVGKSNILKALNLFFNNAPDLDSTFEFVRDLSRLREDEARSAKGRATVWIRVTFNNFLGWRSLPPQFPIKRSWNRYSDLPLDTYPKEIPATTIGRFLNKVAFHYVPAVRGRDIFSHYLRMLHDALIDDEKAGVRAASNTLMTRINESTEDMSREIHLGLGFKSSIKVPEDLRELFEALDFSTIFNDYDIPLQMRGDGVQARHVPFILDFISRHSHKNHIWAYEEPENSLEMGKAFELASQFADEFGRNKQIFVTTHSPAFYDLSGDRVTRWHVQSGPQGPKNSLVTTTDMITATSVPDHALGVAPLIAKRAREVYEENTRLKDSVTDLDRRVRAAQRARVIVEGPSDEIILSRAMERLFPEEEQICDFVPAGGADQVAAYIGAVTGLSFDVPRRVIGLLDQDQAGRKAMEKFKGRKQVPNTEFREVDRTAGVYIGLLIIPNELLDLKLVFKKYTMSKEAHIPMPIEFCFPEEIIREAMEREVLRLSNRFTEAKDGELAFSVNLTDTLRGKLPENKTYFAMKVNQDTKLAFAEWVAQKEQDAFRYLRPTVEVIRQSATQAQVIAARGAGVAGSAGAVPMAASPPS
jgi:predicted ATPase